MGVVRREGNCFIVERFHLVTQEGGMAHTEMDPAALGTLMESFSPGQVQEARSSSVGRTAIPAWAYSGRGRTTHVPAAGFGLPREPGRQRRLRHPRPNRRWCSARSHRRSRPGLLPVTPGPVEAGSVRERSRGEGPERPWPPVFRRTRWADFWTKPALGRVTSSQPTVDWMTPTRGTRIFAR